MTINVAETVRKLMGWCPNASITERKTRVEYNPASINAGLPVKKWRFDLLILGHVCALLFASLFILPMSVYQAFYLYNSSYLALNYGNFLADITLAVASMLFSITTVVLIYSTLIFKKSYSKLCYFNVILLLGLFIAIILELSLVDDYRLREGIYWAFIFALLPLIPSLMNIRFNKRYGENKIVTEGLGLVELIKRAMGWCPNATPRKNRSMQHIDFVNLPQTPSDRSNVENVQFKNVMFSVNTTLLSLCFVMYMNLVLFLGSKMDYAILIPILVATYSLLYFIVAKSPQTSVLIDENGVHLKSYEFRDITLDYKNIKSVTPDKPIKYPIELIGFLAILLTFLIAFLAYSVTVYGDWRLIISVAPLLPGYLLLKYRQDRKYHDIGAQFSIRAENKSRFTRWYELTSHYSIRTDEMTASGIQAAIEHYREEQ